MSLLGLGKRFSMPLTIAMPYCTIWAQSFRAGQEINHLSTWTHKRAYSLMDKAPHYGREDLKKVLIKLNDLKKEGIIQDYAIFGGYAVMLYDAAPFTYDLDVLVLLSTKDDYSNLWEHFRTKKARVEGEYIFIEGMPVQFFPSYISPLFHDAIKEASRVEFKGLYTKFASAEYLILFFLTSFRKKDRVRIRKLLGKVNRDTLLGLIKRFDDEQRVLSKNYKRVLANT